MKFRFDNPYFEFMNTLSHFIGVNVIFIVTCLPIITIGPALAGLYTVMIKEAKDEGPYIIKGYLKAFRANLRQGICATLVFLFLTAVFLFNVEFWFTINSATGTIIGGIMIAACLLLLICYIYTFPLMSCFENSLKQTMKNSLLIGIQNFKETLILIVALAATTALTFLFSYFAVFMVLLGFALFTYCSAFLFNRVFKKYES